MIPGVASPLSNAPNGDYSRPEADLWYVAIDFRDFRIGMRGVTDELIFTGPVLTRAPVRNS
jgi:hypothetical protein